MNDIDTDAVKAAHAQHCTDGHGGCLYTGGCNPHNKPPCEPYRLAEALARAARDRDEALDRGATYAEALAAEQDKVARVEKLLGHSTYRGEFRHILVRDVRAALADQPERAS